MKVNENIKKFREAQNWSQEEAAEQIGMSKNGYARIERGEVQPSLQRLEIISRVFGVEMSQLFEFDKNVVCLISENSQNSSNFYSADEQIISENQKLKLIIAHKDELLEQKDRQIALLNELVDSLKIIKER